MTNRDPSQKTHVALFLPTLEGGGAEKVLRNLAIGFSSLGLNVDMILVRGQGVYMSQLPPDIRVIDLNAHRISASIPGLWRYLLAARPQALLAALDLTNLVAVLTKRIASTETKVFVSVHNLVAYLHGRSLKNKLENVLISWSYSKADGIIAVSHNLAKDLATERKLPLTQIKVIYNPVVTDELFDLSRSEIDHPFFEPNHPPILLGVGRLTKHKDFATLIRAFAIVQERTQARLVILGEGEERAQLEALMHKLGLETSLSMPGFVTNPFAYMRQANVFVLSSISEGLPSVLIEALACECPVVSTNCPGGVAEILAEGKYGYLVPVRDPESMANAILEVLNGNTKEIKREWLNKFSLDQVTKQYIEALNLSCGN